MSKRRTKVTRTSNIKDFNRSIAALLKFVDKMDDKEVDKLLGVN